jgi:hypothetical protein
MGCALNVLALNGLDAIELEATSADLEAVDDVEEGVSIVALQVHQTREVVAVSLGAAEANERGLGHLQDGHNGLKKERRVNVRRLIDDDDICSSSAGSLQEKVRNEGKSLEMARVGE